MIHEDALPKGYPYHKMLPHSQVVDGVRMFPELDHAGTPRVAEALLCLVCAYHKRWGTFDQATGVAVCAECRDAANAAKAPEKPQRLRSGAYAWMYTQYLPKLQGIARDNGYALAVHGSMHTDLDLVACPWTDGASAPEVLVEALRSYLGGKIFGPEDGDINPQTKPHGRLAWSIYPPDRFGPGGPYIDISVMPRLVNAD